MSVQFVNLHTHHQLSDENTISIVNQYPNEFDKNIKNYSVGIHPWHLEMNSLASDLEIIEKSCKNNAMLAIGECGLDKRIEQPSENQIIVFRNQLELAKKHNKPVIIHCVRAFQELIALKKELKLEIPMVIHGFSKGLALANQLIQQGFYLSFGKYLIQNPNLKEVFKSVPNDRIFLETDLLDLEILDIYKLGSTYKEIDLLDLQNIIKNNFTKVFKQ